MNKKDILEIKRRMKKTHCTFTRMCGCYVNAEREVVLTFGENFLNLEEDELHKYLEIAAKTLSGTPGNNLLELSFPEDQEEPGGKQQFLMGLRESKLKNDELLAAFYQLVIDNYDYAGNYLILLFHDAYDVITKTSDNNALDESEEVFEYLLAAVCPVTLSKAALGYLESENRIGPRMRDWVVGVPDAGFVFPAFTDRSADIHSVMYYTRDTKEPHDEFMEFILGCPARQTATEKKNTFQDIVNSAVPDERGRARVLYDIHETLQEMVEEKALYTEAEQEPDPILLTPETIQDVLVTSKVPEEIAERIGRSYTEKFSDEPPVADLLVDKKILSSGAQARREEELLVEVQQLKNELGQTKNELAIAQNTARAVSDFADSASGEAAPARSCCASRRTRPGRSPHRSSAGSAASSSRWTSTNTRASTARNWPGRRRQEYKTRKKRCCKTAAPRFMADSHIHAINHRGSLSCSTFFLVMMFLVKALFFSGYYCFY